MLLELSVENLVLIDKLHLKFDGGLIAITGETGAGKSVFLTSLKLLSGIKASPQLIRKGAKSALVEGIFNVSELPALQQEIRSLEIEVDDELIIQREILSSGKSRVRVNGMILPLADLQKFSTQLIQLHGQSEQTLLKDVRSHLNVLDDFGQNQSILQTYNEKYSIYSGLKAKKEELLNNVKSLNAQRDFLEFQYKELEALELKEGEEDEIESKLSGMNSIEEINDIKKECDGFLSSDSGILSNMESLRRKLADLEDLLPTLDKSSAKVQEYISGLEGIYEQITKTDHQQDYDPHEVDALNNRMAVLQRAQRKYKTDHEGLLALFEKRKEEISNIENQDLNMEDLEFELNEAYKDLEKVAFSLSEKRKKDSNVLDKLIQENLSKLGMEGSQFQTQIKEKASCGSTGKDEVEFFIAPNKGEGLKPMKSTLSGGELSRFMLSLKKAMAEKDHVSILVFDEVDSGIGGNVAHYIAECLQELSHYHQLFSITHLHQIAGKANAQLKVEKESDEERTTTHIKFLNKEERVQELARMMGGEGSDAVIKHAEELINSI